MYYPRKLYVNKVKPVIDVVLFYMAAFTAIVELPRWEIIEPWMNARFQKALTLIPQNWLRIDFNVDPLFYIIPRLLQFIIVILLINSTIIRSKRFWLTSFPLIAILVTSWLSRFWSVSVQFSQLRFLYFSAVVLSGVYIGLNLPINKTRRLFEVLAVVLVLASIFAGYFRPNYSVFAGGEWTGIFWWKSYLGEIAGLSALFFLFRWGDYKKSRKIDVIFSLIFYLLCIFLLYKSKSVTQSAALIFSQLVVIALISYTHWGKRLKLTHWLILIFFSLIFLSILWLSKDIILASVNRDLSFTGRVPVWEALIPFIKKNWLLGYGFGEAFWKIPSFRAELAFESGWDVPFAHNGFIEIILGTGIIGLVLWFVFFGQVTFLSIKYFLLERTFSSTIFISWIAYIMVANLADNMLGTYENFTVLLLMIAFTYSLKVSLEKSKLQPKTPPMAPSQGLD